MKSIAVTVLLLCLTSHLWAQVDPPIVLEERVQQLEAGSKLLKRPYLPVSP